MWIYNLFEKLILERFGKEVVGNEMSNPYLEKSNKLLHFMWICIILQLIAIIISSIWYFPVLSFFAYGMCFLVVFSAIYNLLLLSEGKKKLKEEMRKSWEVNKKDEEKG